LARVSRSTRAGPRSFSGWKKNPLSIPRHEPRICQFHTSVTGVGSRRVSAIVCHRLVIADHQPVYPA
jgi:hypothetical protein